MASLDRTMRIDYDQPLDVDSVPSLSEITVTSAVDGLLTTQSIVIFGSSVYVGVNLRQQGLISVNYSGTAIQNEGGEAAAAIINQLTVNGTGVSDVTVPYPVGGTISGGALLLYFSEVLNPANVPAVGSFLVTIDGDAVVLSGLSIYGTLLSGTAAPAAFAGAIAVLTYTPPVLNPLQDYAALQVPPIATLLLVNLSTTQTGFWTTRALVEDRWGHENTRKWSNKGDSDSVDADPVAWQQALDDTDSKFNADFLNNDYDLDDLTPTWLATSPYAARVQVLAKIWAGTELYFARGLLDVSSGGNSNLEERDNMQGWRNYVDAELEKMFDAGLDIEIDEDAPASADGFQSVDIVRDTDVVIDDEFSSGF
jgi:hypothetical protein